MFAAAETGGADDMLMVVVCRVGRMRQMMAGVNIRSAITWWRATQVPCAGHGAVYGYDHGHMAMWV